MAEAKQRGGRTQAERSATTREAIVAAATRLFAERGYEATGIDEVTRAAGVSKGALYHHYSDKADVLAAVYEDVETKLVERLVAVASRETDPLEAVRAGAHAFLDACVDPVTRQIVLVDAPVGLGWERWRSIGSRYGFGLLLAGLQAAADAGQIAGDHLEERAAPAAGRPDRGVVADVRQRHAEEDSCCHRRRPRRPHRRNVGASSPPRAQSAAKAIGALIAPSRHDGRQTAA